MPGGHLLAVHEPGAADRLLQARADVGVQALERAGEGLGGHPDAGRPDAVEALGEVEKGLHPPLADVVAQRPHPLHGVLDVEGCAGHDPAQGTRSQGPATQVESSDHPVESRRGVPLGPPGRRPEGPGPRCAGRGPAV